MGNSSRQSHDIKDRNYLDQSIEDRVLWQSFKKGNELAFSSLYKKYVNKFYNYGMHLSFDKEIVLDTIQELFTNLWAKHSQLADVQAVNYYLFKVFRNLLFQKANQKKNSFISIDENSDFEESDLTREESLIVEQTTHEQHVRLQVAMKSLSKRQKEVVLLKFYNELSYQQVASVMEISVESAHNLLSKAIHTLRNSLTFLVKKTAHIALPLVLLVQLYMNELCKDIF